MKKKRVKKNSKQRKPSAARTKISQAITWMGIVMIGILAVPTGLLMALISAIWSVTDKITEWIGDGKRGRS